jgi:hypothetical protein
MGKKKFRSRGAKMNVERAKPNPSLVPRIIFAGGDADVGYTEGKLWRLARRLKDQLGWKIIGVSHDRNALAEAQKLKLETQYIPIESPGVTVAERLQATDEMIRMTADINIPGSHLPLWKVLAMDDFLASLQLYRAQPVMDVRADAIVVPIMAIDNNTRGSCGLYTWLMSEGRRNGIPVLGLEVSPMGNKNTLCHLPADHYAVKSEWSKEFLVRQQLAEPDQISVLRWEESYQLWPGKDDFAEAFSEHEATARTILGVPWDEPVILIPHHVAFGWEVRRILRALATLDFTPRVVIRVDSRTVRRHFHEREIVLESYGDEIRALPHVIIDERVGIGLLLQLADLVIAPFAGTATERASLCRKPAIICQSMGHEGWQSEFTYWEPQPEKLPALIHSWRERGWLKRKRCARIVAQLVGSNTRAQASSAFANDLPCLNSGIGMPVSGVGGYE